MTTRESLHDLLDEIPDDRLADAERELERLAHEAPERASVHERPRRPIAEVIAEIRRARMGNRLDGLTVRELIEEGRA